MSQRMVFVTEASSEIGLGHFMRCFALAEEAASRNLAVVFLMPEVLPVVARHLASIGATSRSCPHPWKTSLVPALESLCLSGDDWIVLDSYALDAALVTALSASHSVLLFDDLCALDSYHCALIVNASINAHAQPYSQRQFAGQLLAGPRYAMVRSEFSVATSQAPGKIIAVVLGGSDPSGLSAQCALLAAEAAPDHLVRIIAGPANMNLPALRQLAATRSGIELHHAPDTMTGVLAGASLVITAAGNTVGELCAMELAALVLVVVDNQVAALDACPYPVLDARDGLPADFGRRLAALLADADGLAKIASNARELIDGQGCRHAIDQMLRGVPASV